MAVFDKAFGEVWDRLKSAQNLQDLENLRIEILGKKGILTEQFALLRELSQEEKKQKAKELNALKDEFESIYTTQKQKLESAKLHASLEGEKIDVSLFSGTQRRSVGHPINYTKDKIIQYFISMGYELCEGPLVEDDFHNFTALNIPQYHPAREMQDTFYFNDSKLLRTHTSPVQIRTMLSQKPPIKMICPGATFRRDYDLTHSPMFHQIEGLLVDEVGKVSFAHLKYVLENFLRFMFGEVKVRFRSSFFPFTEPSAEVDISCVFCGGDGCRVCSHSGWLEVLGCGLVNDNVFKAVGYENVSGFAFGMGIERLCMLSLGISDMRSLYENDLALLEQF
ncbi:phenylalanine--tRNA ligase subunit alpha [Helicobacter macacae]|uniref:Phenylalanine--tRNA ligase alpha subunit n=1 Tax=Helicobacter macacae MIT 99-5501 TaxID=1357400 RepID=V8CDE4_9HELI|nr:phenylalanine--tRNA ligase subunit alpha [Helicobacter macacae]ETD25122.1 phenylalanine-tRNA ligase, alpha subunit [Helicobacter macacae MIT 99-5501]